MSSSFDSEVYTERQRLPGVSINAVKLMKHLLWSITSDALRQVQEKGVAPVSISLEYRPDVDTSEWWTVKWGPEPQQYASATTLELALFRAAVRARKDDEGAKKYQEQTP